MSFAFYPETIPQLIHIINECNKQYFNIKNTYHYQLEHINEYQPPNQIIHLYDFIDTQHTIIKELEQTVTSLSNELSFRRLIIERKDHILKDLNSIVINKFIDKLYKQELTISELKYDNSKLQRYRSINSINISNIPLNENYSWNIQPIITNITNVKSIPLNVIVPKNRSEYKGALSIINPPMKQIKNIDRFINIKKKQLEKSKTKVHWSLDKNSKDIKESQRNSNELRNNSTETQLKKMMLHKRLFKNTTATSRSQNEYFLTKADKEINVKSFNYHTKNETMNDMVLLTSSESRNSKLNRNQASLLNKSYEVIKNFQSKQLHR